MKTKGDGGGSSKSGATDDSSDKDHVWMRLYQLSEDQIRGQLMRGCAFCSTLIKPQTVSSDIVSLKTLETI